MSWNKRQWGWTSKCSHRALVKLSSKVHINQPLHIFTGYLEVYTVLAIFVSNFFVHIN